MACVWKNDDCTFADVYSDFILLCVCALLGRRTHAEELFRHEHLQYGHGI